ncbi:MAG: hypothetical protein AB7G08_32630, partial [Hyphomicrobiaceae bacterium]
MRIPDFQVSKFGGLNTGVRDKKALRPGIATDSKNWLSAKYGDHIELRRGMALLGETRVDGAGKITGLGVAQKADGTQIPFWSRGRKIEYYDAATADRAEVGSDLLPTAAEGEDVWFAPYQNLAGAFQYLGSRNSSVWKIPTANPASAVDQSVSNFRWGIFKIGRGRALAGRRNGTTAGNKDDTGAYLSQIDHALLTDFPAQVTAEVVGALGSTNYTGTLAQRTGVRTVMYVAIKEAGGETLVDDRNGNLVGDQGSTGTINYATGAYDVTFNHTTTGAVTADYYYEDATSGGILDFAVNSGSGEPKIFRQDDGGLLMGIAAFLDVNYWLHTLKTWALTISLDDTESTNLPYRAVGIPYTESYCETPDGILLIDTSNPNEPKVRRLEIGRNTNNLTIVPTAISDALDLSIHAFDYAVAFRWGDY